MAILSDSSSSLMLSLKVLLISSGVLSMAVILKLSVPLVAEFAVSDLPSLWSVFSSWLRPPYLYLVINCIIITIVASSKLQQKVDEIEPPPVKSLRADHLAAAYDVVAPKISAPVAFVPEFGGEYYLNGAKVDAYGGDVDSKVSETETETETVMPVTNAPEETTADVVDEVSISKSSWTPEKTSSEYLSYREKPPVSVRIGHRKAVKASPEGGRTLGVSKPRRNDTLESTWKTITEGRAMPLTRHLRKSDTWEMQGRHVGNNMAHHSHDDRMTKSERFTQGTGTGTGTLPVPSPPPPPPTPLNRSSGSGKLKKEPSLGQEELNRRVEAFIKKFNEEMRLQRQESLNQYMEMINRGAH